MQREKPFQQVGDGFQWHGYNASAISDHDGTDQWPTPDKKRNGATGKYILYP